MQLEVRGLSLWLLTVHGFILENVGSVNATFESYDRQNCGNVFGRNVSVYQFNVSVMNATNAPSCLNNTGGTTPTGPETAGLLLWMFLD